MGAPAVAAALPSEEGGRAPGLRHDVFISYAHADGALFVDSLVERLRAAGLDVWLDLERRPPGAPIDGTLAAALQRCRTAVFVVTEGWVGRPYTRFELDVFAKEERRPYIAVIRIPDPRLSALGAFLPEEKWLRWSDRDDADELFWQLYCGLLGKEPGPRKDWKRRGAETAQGGRAPLADLRTAAEPRAEIFTALVGEVSLPAVLACDRKPQWADVCEFAVVPRSEAWFVVGPRRHAHELFLRRLRLCLAKQPDRRMLRVRWAGGTPPVGRNGYLQALAGPLGARTEDELVSSLRAQLLDANLVVLHQPVTEEAFDREDLVLYYTRWLPDLVARVDPDNRPDDRVGAVKAVQAIAWWGDGDGSHLPGTLQREAQHLVARIREAQDRRLPVRVLPELGAISREDVERWCDDYLPADWNRSELVARVMDGARDPAEILERLVRLFEDDGGSET